MTPPRILRAAEGRRMPWKNGGGETVEVMTHPSGAGLDAFDWRVSMALIAADGPFSLFPGVDRILAILDGAGLDLAVGGAAPVRLTGDSAPFAFPADAACAGSLLGGPVRDLNVMVRRGRFAATLARLDAAATVTVPAGATALVVCRTGGVGVGGAVLARHDALVLDGPAAVEVAPEGAGASALVVTIRPA